MRIIPRRSRANTCWLALLVLLAACAVDPVGPLEHAQTAQGTVLGTCELLGPIR